MGRLAILSGSGDLPLRLSQAHKGAVLVSFVGVPHALGETSQDHSFEKMGSLFAALKEQGVTEVVMAGAMSRPPLDPSEFDDVMTTLAPRLIAAMQGGDDALLRLVIGVFEEQGFIVRGAHEIDPTLVSDAGVLVGDAPSTSAQTDVAKAIEILTTLSPLDVGQGTVVENGLCLGIETLQGTDALLEFVVQTPAHLRKRGGVFVKAPKQGQDLRVDMPTVGPETIKAMQRASLSTLVIAARSVILLEKNTMLDLARSAGISVLAQDL